MARDFSSAVCPCFQVSVVDDVAVVVVVVDDDV